MNVGLVKGCLKTELLSVFWHYSRLNHARPKSFFLPWFIICWSVLAKPNSTGWAARYCMHRNKFSWMSWNSLFAKLYTRLIKTFVFPPCRDRIMRCWLINWTCSRGHRSCIGWEALEHQALWHLPEFRADCRCFCFSVSLGRVSFVVRRIRHLGHEVFGAPVLKCTPGEVHTWTRSCFHFNQGFLSNF